MNDLNKKPMDTIVKHRSPISGIDVWNGVRIATAGYDSQLILWDAGTARPLARAAHDHLVNQCRFSPNGQMLLSASSDYTARIWDSGTLSEIAVLSGHDDDVEMASWHPKGRATATASRDRAIRIFSPQGELIKKIEGHSADVISVEWVAGGEQIVSSSDDGTVRRWDVATGQEAERYALDGETDTVVVTATGLMFAGNDRGEILTLRDGKVATLPCHDAGIKRLVLDGSNRRLLSASYDRTVKLWSIEENGALTPIQVTEAPAVVWLRSAAFVGEDMVIFGSFGSTYATYSLSTNSWDTSRIEDTPGTNSGCVHRGVTYTVGDAGVVAKDAVPMTRLGSLCNFIQPWSERLVTGGQLGNLFDASTGEELYQHHSPLNCGAVWQSGDDVMLAVGTYTGEALIFAQEGGGAVRFVEVAELHDNAIKGLSCDGVHLFSVCATGAAALHDSETVRLQAKKLDAHDKIANGATRLADGRFASVSRDLMLRLWTPSPFASEIISTPHDHSIKCLAASTETGQIATGSYDGKVAIYDVANGAWPLVRKLSRFGISSLAHDADAEEFLATTYGGETFRLPAC